MGNVCSIIFFPPRTPWPTESKRFCYLWVLNDDDSSHWTRPLFGVYGVIWYQPIIDAHQLKNRQKLLWIYFELHNGVQKGNRNIFFNITPCLFCINWIITTSFYKKLNLHISLCHICREKIENKKNYNVFKFLCVWNKI